MYTSQILFIENRYIINLKSVSKDYYNKLQKGLSNLFCLGVLLMI